MLLINRQRFEELVEQFASTALRVTDTNGLNVCADLPRRRSEAADDFHGLMIDMNRISNIVLGALTAACNAPVMVGDEMRSLLLHTAIKKES